MMNYLVAADDNRLDAKLSKRFVHANTYLIVNADTEVITSQDSSMHRDPFTFAQLHRQHSDLSGIITCNIGPRAFEIAKEAGLSVYILRNVTVERAIELVNTGKVPPADQPSLKRSIQDRRHQKQNLSDSNGDTPMDGMHRGKHFGRNRMKHRQ